MDAKETPRPEDLIGLSAFHRILGASKMTARLWMLTGRVQTWRGGDGRLLTTRQEAERARGEFTARREARLAPKAA